MQLDASRPIWTLPKGKLCSALRTSSDGLSSDDASARLERFGPNSLPPLRRRPLDLRFTDQLVHFIALLLWVAGGLAFLAAQDRRLAEQAGQTMASRGMRVIAVALRPGDGQLDEESSEDLESKLSLIGIMGLYAPPTARGSRRHSSLS